MMSYSTQISSWVYWIIPVVAAFVGWFTNWLAVKMIFAPIRFWGIPPYLGWQGVVPRKSKKMASKTVAKSVEKLGGIGDLVEGYGLDVITDHWINRLEPMMPSMIDYMMQKEFEEFWVRLPKRAKLILIKQLYQQTPELIEHAVFDAVDVLDEQFDMHDFIVEQLGQNPEVMNEIFYKSGRPELKFIVWSGLFFGLLFGVLQAVLWRLNSHYLWLPLFGCAIGFITNWLAISIIFRPLRPIKLGPLVIQGLFIRRQKEVAENYCRLIVEKVVNLDVIEENITRRMVRTLFEPSLRSQIESFIQALNFDRTTVNALLGEGGYTRLIDALTDNIASLAQLPLEEHKFRRGITEYLHKRLKTEIYRFSPEEFRDVLKPAFQEEEWALIFMGAVFGLAAGLAQWLLLVI